ncbi:ABC transporter ATP-binding protein [Streptomonospora nanhaiensis]|uniref:Putative ABC transport system ATP-binding protein n=1 Tax=Streptomonospora nanhaiensis TaxID=1323731 RepID=A0A853BJV2_9ACTN|nr:ABC transporter ATP-binding protein [Streptomonospora nanhaiensis]MBV2362542.1 ABC transporter ATP-binding protein/permease [Streptomonospora nanhaiensis]MBX9391038.1 ABC transporter ATP-binding protein/permease [Streptomonospora nanhaiensis]NYI94796.1 putative ABC transport system ATP-binding protein [Streptomonospora nanhaiensis]
MSAPASDRTRPAPGAEAPAAGPGLRRANGGALDTVRRGLRLTPEFTEGLWLTLLLAVVATVGKVVVPIAIQQIIDRGVGAEGGGPDLGFAAATVGVCAVLLAATMAAAYVMNVRLYRATESALATLRRKAFRHVHDLSVLTQNSERKGALVARVTADVDQISTFMQWGGLQLIVSVGQLIVATVLMAVYSWELTLLVWVCFLPLVYGARWLQVRLSRAYLTVRERTGDMLGAIGETVMGAAVIRAHATEERTARRIDTTVLATRTAQVRAQRLSMAVSPFAELVAAVGNAAVVVAGVLLGIGGGITAGELVAFLFLMTLFIAPMMMATEIFNEAQNAIAGWRRVLGVLDTVPDIADPGEAGRTLPRGPVAVRFERVSYAYPDGPTVLDGVDEEIAPGTRVAVVGETGSGKTTFVKLLTRLMDPVEGRVLIDGVDLREVAFSSLRGRVVMVPQEGFLFDSSLGANIRFARPEATDAELEAAVAELGLADWLAGLAHGLDTPVGQRGESLSAGERQLVALVRAYVADPDLLVLDEATSAVDPDTEVRIQRALDRLTRGRTSVAIAHRLSTAEAADEVLVFDEGRVVQRGTHEELAAVPGVYADLYASWVRSSA